MTPERMNRLDRGIEVQGMTAPVISLGADTIARHHASHVTNRPGWVNVWRYDPAIVNGIGAAGPGYYFAYEYDPYESMSTRRFLRSWPIVGVDGMSDYV